MDREVASHDRYLWVDTLPHAQRAADLSTLRSGGVVVERLRSRDASGEIQIKGGLIHHWIGTVFIPGVPIGRVVGLMQDYDRHASVFGPYIARSALLAHDDDEFTFSLRFHLKKVITVVVDTENVAHFARPAPDRAYSRIVSTRANEVDDPDTPSEHHEPEGHDGGYLWRLNSYWTFLERDGGTYLQCESISLTRGIPIGLGWLIRPFVTSIPRESLQFMLETARRTLAPR